MSRKVWLLFAAVTIVISGCATVREYRVAAQQLDVALKTYPGGTIVKITKQKDLPNAFGKADLFGGKIDQGFNSNSSILEKSMPQSSLLG